MAFKDITGKIVGKLTALRRIGVNRAGNAVWECQCECGKLTKKPQAYFGRNRNLSCGCADTKTKPCIECGCEFGSKAWNAIRCRKRKCQLARGRKYRAELWERDRAGVLAKTALWRSGATALVSILLICARNRAKKYGLPFLIGPKDIVIPSHCPVLGIRIERGVGRSCDGSPTIDRIVPSLGYVKENIAIISHRANRIKSDASIEEIERVLSYMKNHSQQNIVFLQREQQLEQEGGK